ncbi:zinc ribbon domain-containing protein [Zooshikella sp. RANM57]|uniref:zinc ribbon domain-containing protein n=1 Tax=Zooshikella sp. RANM57 TaxID=3425863 RepID=UPI003D6F0A4E
MKCPKCQCEQPDSNTACKHCGIIFEKYFKYHPTENSTISQTETSIYPKITLKETLFYPGEKVDSPSVYSRAAVLIVISIWGLLLIFSSISSNATGSSFLHLINLPFHEAGHVIFRPFGEFMTSLGGTLGQLLMPLICFYVFLIKQHNTFAASVCAWWFGENFLDMAPYINDARAGQLLLLGGNYGHSSPYGFHDWEYILTETGLLQYDQSIAVGVHCLGSIIMISSVLWGTIIVLKQFKMLH